MVIKSKTLRFAFLGIALIMFAVGAFAFSAHATHAAAPSVSTTTTAHVSILRHKGGTVFGKTTLTVTHGVPFSFDNRTITAQSVTMHGTTLKTINPKSSASYTFKTAGTYTLNLASNSAAVLTVTVQ